MIFARECLRDIAGEIFRLGELHWQETEAYRHGQQFNPDVERYLHYNDIGYHIQFTARVDGRLVGHAGMYLCRSMHTQQLVAHEDTWFMLKEYRKGRNAIRLWKYVEQEMRKMGAAEIAISAKLANSSGRIMELIGYRHTESIYSRQFPENVHVHLDARPAAAA